MDVQRWQSEQQQTRGEPVASSFGYPKAIYRFRLPPLAVNVYSIMWTLAGGRETAGRPYNSTVLAAEMYCDSRSIRDAWKKLREAGLIRLVKEGRYDQEYAVAHPQRVLDERIVAAAGEEQTALDFDSVEVADVIAFAPEAAPQPARQPDQFATNSSGPEISAERLADDFVAKRSGYHGHDHDLKRSISCHDMQPERAADRSAPVATPEPEREPEVPADSVAALVLRRLEARRRELGIVIDEPTRLGTAGQIGSGGPAQRAREPTSAASASSGRRVATPDEVAVLAAELRSRVADPDAHPLLFRDVALDIVAGKVSRDRVFGEITELDLSGVKGSSRGRMFRSKFGRPMKPKTDGAR